MDINFEMDEGFHSGWWDMDDTYHSLDWYAIDNPDVIAKANNKVVFRKRGSNENR